MELIQNYFFLPVYFIALAVSIFHYKKYFDTALRYFPLIIAYTFFNELLGNFIRYNENFAFFPKTTNSNQIIYNIYIVIFFSYFFSTFYTLISNKIFKVIIGIASFITLLSYIINSFYQNPLKSDLIYSNAIGSWTLLICCTLYFLGLKPSFQWQSDKYNLMVWIAFGLIVFYLFFPHLFLVGYSRLDLWEKYNLRTILKILIVIMYTFFCIGFIISRRRAFR